MASFVLHVHFIFLFHLLLGFCSGDFQYECAPETNTTVKININKTINGFEQFKLTELSSTCTPSTENADLFILKSCPVERNITVEFTKAENDEVLRGVNVRIFTLRCIWTKETVIQTVTASVEVKEGAGTPVQTQNFTRTGWAPTLKLTVDTDTKSIIIGTNLTVKISLTGQKYKFAAEHCKAFAGTHSHILWDSKNCSLIDGQLFGTSKWNRSKDSTEITHHLEAFRFADNHTLALECIAKICPKGKEKECDLDCSHSQRRRRRRDVNSRTTVVKTILNVVDSFQDISNSGSGPFLATSLVSTAVIMYAMVL